MKILVTGGYGFIGSNFIKYLLKKYKDIEIINIDKLTYCSNIDNLKHYEDKVMFFHMDINDPDIEFVLKKYKPDTIVHFAANTHVDRSIRFPREFIETDVLGTFNLVYHTLKQGIDRFIHVSTDEVYGPINKGDFKEADKFSPTSPYAGSKAAGDLLIQTYIKTYRFPAIIVRPCNNYGPNQYPEKLIPCALARLLQNRKVILHGQGREIREWLFVEDCCRAIDGIMRYGKIGEVYNIGSEERINNLMVVKAIIKHLYGTTHDCHKLIRTIHNRPGNDSRYAIDSTKSRLVCGNYISVNFDQGLQATIDWYRRNQDWISNTGVDLDSNIYFSNEDYLR